MSATLIFIILLGLLALLLFAVEALVMPGFGLAGIGAAVCTVVADVLVYNEYGGMAALGALFLSTLVILAFFWWLGRPGTLRHMELKSVIGSTAATDDQLAVRPGDEGRALTRLALIGNAEIGGRRVEVKSAGEFIEPGTPVVVIEVNEALILVRARD